MFPPHLFGQAKAAFRPSWLPGTPPPSPPLSRPVLKTCKQSAAEKVKLRTCFFRHFRHSCPREFLKASPDSSFHGGFTGVFGCFLA
jgi:hypothetical protein